MKKRISYTDEPLGNVEVVKDFLPPPEKLVLREDNVKVTIALSKSSVSFFKKIAKRHRTPYQAMIRRILNLYADKYGQ
jgi:predicted DNA binding CopG/RHH family protein